MNYESSIEKCSKDAKSQDEMLCENFELLKGQECLAELEQYFIKETSVEKAEKSESDSSVIINLDVNHNEDLIPCYVDEMNKTHLLSEIEEKTLVDLVKLKSELGTRILMSANSRLVFTLARQSINPDYNLFGLVQIGNIAVMKALEKIEYIKYFKSISLYRCWWVRFTLSKCIENKIRAIRIPLSMIKMIEPLENTLKQAKMIL